MQIWVDADACPKAIKEVIFRASKRTEVMSTFVSNHLISLPASIFIKRVIVSQGFDVADRYIIEHARPNDLVITSDIPLANEVIKKGAHALSHRGTHYTQRNISQHMANRELFGSLRDCGLLNSGPSTIAKKDLQLFANGLDKILTHS